MMDDLIYGLAAFCAGADAADQLIFAARASGLYSASNVNGEWRKVCNPVETGLPPTATVVAIPPRSGETARYVFAGMQGGVLRTSNSGADWYYSPLSAPPPVISSIAISPNFAADGVVVVGMLEDGVFRSEDHGRSWTPSNFGLLDMRVFSLVMSPQYMTDDTMASTTIPSARRCSTAQTHTSFRRSRCRMSSIASAAAMRLLAAFSTRTSAACRMLKRLPSRCTPPPPSTARPATRVMLPKPTSGL
jgi:hypothetical protein